jgi:hypothetical protein
MATYGPASRLFFVLALIALPGCVGLGGERITLEHEPLRPPPYRATEPLLMQKSVDDIRDSKDGVGRATATLFAFTVGGIVTATPLGEQVALQVADALRFAGYDVQPVDGGYLRDQHDPSVIVEIERFWFKNYNLFWPIVPTWGDVTLGFRVQAPQGRILYDRSFNASGTSYCLEGECAFTTASSEALTEILNQIVDVATSAEFRRALGLDPLGASPSPATPLGPSSEPEPTPIEAPPGPPETR